MLKLIKILPLLLLVLCPPVWAQSGQLEPLNLQEAAANLTPEQVDSLQKMATYLTPRDVLTPKQMKLLDQLGRSTSPSRELIQALINSVTDKQWGIIHRFFPGLKMTPELTDKIINLVQKVYAIAYNTELPVMERARRLKQLARQVLGKQTVDRFLESVTRNICIWDPVGRSGPIFQAAMDQSAKMRALGIQLNLVPYTDESVLVADLQSNHCDAGLMSGMRARSFNRFSGTVDAVGAITTKKQMHTLLYVLSRPAMAKHMISGSFVTLGIAQAGAAYIFVNDKSINSLSNAAGKKVAVLGYDPVQAEMVAAIGATPVPASMFTAPNMFNNGVVDVLAAPLVAYNALELYKGMTPNGGIVNYPLAQISMQLIGWRFKIPNVIGQLVRESFFNNYDKIEKALNAQTENIPDHWWIPIPKEDKADYTHMMKQARLTLLKKGYYDGDMLELQRKIRCKYNPSRAECTTTVKAALKQMKQ